MHELATVWVFFFLPSLPFSLSFLALLCFSRRSLLGGSSAVVALPQSVCYCHSSVFLEMSYLINTPEAISHLFLNALLFFFFNEINEQPKRISVKRFKNFFLLQGTNSSEDALSFKIILVKNKIFNRSNTLL